MMVVFSRTATSKLLSRKTWIPSGGTILPWIFHGRMSLFQSCDGYDGVVDDFLFLSHVPTTTAIGCHIFSFLRPYLVTVSIFAIRPNSGSHYILLVSICLLFFCCNRRRKGKKVKCWEDKWNTTMMVCGDGLAVPGFLSNVSYYLFMC